MNKKFWKAAFTRAYRTTFQNLASTFPVGLVVTVEMIEKADWKILYAILAWLLTGILGGISSILTSMATGLPEVKEEE